MTDYLVLPHMRVQGANMYNAAFLLGGPPVLAAWLMAHALGRKIDMADDVLAMAFILHSYTPLGEYFKNEFHPQLRRGAAYTFVSRDNKSDYLQGSCALSLQPVARAHMEVSLIIGIRKLVTAEKIDFHLATGRLAGGVITRKGKSYLCSDASEALERIGTGYVVMDRRDLLERERVGNRAEQFVAALGHKPVKGDGMSWLSATCLGYAATTPFEKRSGVREGYEHAFAEPLVGLVQYVPIRSCLDEDRADQTLWRSEWATPDVFRIYQDQR